MLRIVMKCICKCYEMHMQHQKRISPTFTKDPIDDYKTYAVWKNISAQSLHFLLIVTAKKTTPTFCHSRPDWFAVCRCKATLGLQNVHADTFKYRKIQICKLFKKFSNYKKFLQQIICDIIVQLKRYWF